MKKRTQLMTVRNKLSGKTTYYRHRETDNRYIRISKDEYDFQCLIADSFECIMTTNTKTHERGYKVAVRNTMD